MRRTERLLKLSGLPREKNLDTLQLKRLPTKVRRQVSSPCDGGFVDRAENILAFGLPGRGKTHLLCAIGHELIGRGHRVLPPPIGSYSGSWSQKGNSCWNRSCASWTASPP